LTRRPAGYVVSLYSFHEGPQRDCGACGQRGGLYREKRRGEIRLKDARSGAQLVARTLRPAVPKRQERRSMWLVKNSVRIRKVEDAS
jgi:hypothetical protein